MGDFFKDSEIISPQSSNGLGFQKEEAGSQESGVGRKESGVLPLYPRQSANLPLHHLGNAGPNVRVEFVKPQNYTDVSFRSMTPASAGERLIDELSRTIQDSAAKHLARYELDVRILDVHMAGRPAFEAPGVNSDFANPQSHHPAKDFPPICGERTFGEGGCKGRSTFNRPELPMEHRLPEHR
jgi:hypothetical protein